MKELDFIEIIKEQTKNRYIGDDCAYLKDFGIVVTQDNFVEGVHFKLEWASPYQIGYKAVVVNISDILASGAEPKYITVGLSMPDVDYDFVEELYRGINAGLYGAEVVGGDITGSDKLFISITAIGSAAGRRISSRENAKPGYVVITHGKYGESSNGLRDLIAGKKKSQFIKSHLEPKLEPDFSRNIASRINVDYAMMDTSDGLADALFKIAKSSGCSIVADNIEGMYGAEDYHLVAAVPEDFLLEMKDYYVIGKVQDYDGAYLKIGDKSYKDYNDLNLFNHFQI